MSDVALAAAELEQARTAFFEGVEHFEAQRLLQAHAAFERALKLTPQRPSVMLNLGVTRVGLGRYADAVPLLAAAVQAEPHAPDGWAALAVAQFELAQWAAAAQAFDHAFSQGMATVPMRLQHGNCLLRLGQSDAAKQAFKQLLAIDEHCAQAWYQVGDLQRESGRTDDAINSYRKAASNGFDPALIDYVLSALKARAPILQPPRAYVQGLFDQYAQDFDQHLVGQLGYQGHRMLIEQLPAGREARFDRVLDLGCGTGLCGPLLRSRADWLVGVDFSPAMIAKASALCVYDGLTTLDVHEYLEIDTSSWRLVLAADVFIYLGDLQPLFALLAQRLDSGGWLSFTVERAATGQGVQLLPSLRYAHSPDYLDGLARRYGFDVVAVIDAAIRIDQGQPVAGQYWHLRKAA
jgi:predicted TPR repeat methyltransferase